MVSIIKSKFHGDGKEGDFSWMIKQPHHDSTFFLFNDNEGEFYKHFRGGRHTCSAGGGNAAIRPFQCLTEPRALGIPTGSYEQGPHYGGYSSLDDHVKQVLTDAFTQVESLISTRLFTSIAFSWDDNTKLGGRIFNTSQDVRDFIVEEIYRVAAKY